MAHRKRGSQLEQILKFKPVRDQDNRRFIPYCDYGWHYGIICTSKKYQECERRHCKHYYQLYISKDQQ